MPPNGRIVQGADCCGAHYRGPPQSQRCCSERQRGLRPLDVDLQPDLDAVVEDGDLGDVEEGFRTGGVDPVGLGPGDRSRHDQRCSKSPEYIHPHITRSARGGPGPLMRFGTKTGRCIRRHNK